MQWYYSKDGSQLGPIEQSELLGKLAAGEVRRTDLVWRDGMRDWVPAAQVPELAGLPQSAPPQPGGSVSPYQSPASAAPAAIPLGDIPTYLVQSILVTLFCCLPFGIAAIVFASRVETLKASGDYAAAKAASDKARMWCWWSFGVGLTVSILYLIAVLSGSAGA